MRPLKVMQTLNKLGGKHGIGRVDIVENRFVGMKGRGVYETPGGAILHFAHRQMETLTMDREVMHLRDSLIPKYSELVYNGFWFSPEREALQALVTETQRDVTVWLGLNFTRATSLLPAARVRRACTIQRSPPWKAKSLPTTKATRPASFGSTHCD